MDMPMLVNADELSIWSTVTRRVETRAMKELTCLHKNDGH